MMCFDWKWEFRQNVLNVFRLEYYTSNNKNIYTYICVLICILKSFGQSHGSWRPCIIC